MTPSPSPRISRYTLLRRHTAERPAGASVVPIRRLTLLRRVDPWEPVAPAREA